MIKASMDLQELRRKIYLEAKAESAWRFWGLFVHVCKLETLREAYKMAKRNNGAPGIDGVSFADIESAGVEEFLSELREELVTGQYRPLSNRRKEIPKGGGKVRTLGIPTIRGRVVQGALKLILEPIFEADFQGGSYGYRPKRTAHQAVARIKKAVVLGLTRVIDLDLKTYFDTVSHSIVLRKVALRVNDDAVMRLLKRILKASGKKGVPQGGVISPLLSNLYLNDVDRMLERAVEVTRRGRYPNVEYARFADDIVVLMSGHPKSDWLMEAIPRRLREELAKLEVQINEEKTRTVDLAKGEAFSFVGFDFRRMKSRQGKWAIRATPRMKARTHLISQLRELFRRNRSQPISKVLARANPILRGWVNYFRVGESVDCFSYVRYWMERKIRRHMMRARGRQGFGWKRWSSTWIHRTLGVYSDYRLVRLPEYQSVPSR
ncbi:group II intron reverse transcriptase/maturase [Planctomycetota bacterium]